MTKFVIYILQDIVDKVAQVKYRVFPVVMGMDVRAIMKKGRVSEEWMFLMVLEEDFGDLNRKGDPTVYFERSIPRFSGAE